MKTTKVFVRFEDNNPEHDIAAILFRQYLRTIIQSKGVRIEDLIEKGNEWPTGFVVTLSQEQRVRLEEERYEVLAKINGSELRGPGVLLRSPEEVEWRR
jgi:hypothetical protein